MAAGVPIGWWVGFHLLVFALLAIDLFVAGRSEGISTAKNALGWTALWIGVALLFGCFIAFRFGRGPALEYFSAYVVEESLSVDNLFVFLLLFRYFQVTGGQQRRVLFYGVLGAFVMRGAFIAAGVQLLARFNWVIYIFAVILLVTAVRLLRPAKKSGNTPPRWIGWVERALPLDTASKPETFITRSHGRTLLTTLFLVLIAVEVTDLLFALDSVPAVLAITRRPFIAYTSNVFAVLGLRSLFPALTGALARFHLLHYGLALILIFVAAKMLLSPFLDIPVTVSLGVIVGVLTLSAFASVWRPKPLGKHAD